MDMFSGIEKTIFAFVALILFAVVFLYLPVRLYAEAECYRRGYPEARITIGLERYCMNLDGSVTVKVEHQ